MKINVAATTHIGHKKRSNQDRILVRVGEVDSKEFGLFVIADGMGGLSHGEKAADIAVQESDRWWNSDLRILIQKNKVTKDNIVNTLNDLVQEIHQIIVEESNKLGESMGTTVTILLVINNQYYTVHVGDSRVYEVAQHVIQITKDHSWVQSEIDAGRLTEQEAAVHPKRNALIQCAGMPGKPKVHNRNGAMRNNSAFLLCSDGFYHYIDINQCKEIKGLSEQGLTDWLVKAERHILSQIAHDNLTAITVTIE